MVEISSGPGRHAQSLHQTSSGSLALNAAGGGAAFRCLVYIVLLLPGVRILGKDKLGVLRYQFCLQKGSSESRFHPAGNRLSVPNRFKAASKARLPFLPWQQSSDPALSPACPLCTSTTKIITFSSWLPLNSTRSGPTGREPRSLDGEGPQKALPLIFKVFYCSY